MTNFFFLDFVFSRNIVSFVVQKLKAIHNKDYSVVKTFKADASRHSFFSSPSSIIIKAAKKRQLMTS